MDGHMIWIQTYKTAGDGLDWRMILDVSPPGCKSWLYFHLPPQVGRFVAYSFMKDFIV